MGPDDIDNFILDLSDFLNQLTGTNKFDTDEYFDPLDNFVMDYLDKFCTIDRNYN